MDQAQTGTESPPKCILVVDDSVDSANALSRLLKLQGHAGHAVYSGSSALEAARTLMPDAILLDLSLPDMDGAEVAAQIRASDNLRFTILIAVTGHSLQPGALPLFDGQVVKPAELKTIFNVIRKAEADRAQKASSPTVR